MFLSLAQLPLTQWSDGHPITLPGLADLNDSEPEPDIVVIEPLGRIYSQRHPYPEDVFWVIEYAHSSLTKEGKSG